jgi:MarR family
MANQPPAILTWRNLHLADTAVCDALNARLAEKAGCSLVEHDLLAWLAAAPGKRLRMLDLATHLRVTPGGLTRIIDRLVDRGKGTARPTIAAKSTRRSPAQGQPRTEPPASSTPGSSRKPSPVTSTSRTS